MEFTLDTNTMFKHIMLSHADLCTEVATTPEWTENGKINVTLTLNGVDFPAQLLEDHLKEMWKQAQNNANDAVDEKKFQQRVEERAIAIVKEHSDGVLDKLNDLCNTLNDPENLIVPFWERTENITAKGK